MKLSKLAAATALVAMASTSFASLDATAQLAAKDALSSTMSTAMPKVHSVMTDLKNTYARQGFPGAMDSIVSAASVKAIAEIDRGTDGLITIQYADTDALAGTALNDRFIQFWPSKVTIDGVAHIERFYCTTNVDGGFLTKGSTVVVNDRSVLSDIAGGDRVLSTCQYQSDLDTPPDASGVAAAYVTMVSE